MAERQIALEDLDEQCIGEFINALRSSGHHWRGIRPALLLLLDQLRLARVVPDVEAARGESPGASLLSRYEDYLRHERALAASTITGYLALVGPFVAERLEGPDAAPASLTADDVRDFLSARTRSISPRSAQLTGGALRSFLRFLFLRGETPTDLARAVPAVRRGRLLGVPRYISPEEVERVLSGCDRSAATGRRDYAILLVLARLGLRSGEVVALQLDDLRWRTGEVIVHGKGLVQDRLPLPADVGEAIAEYLQNARPPGHRYRNVFLRCRAPYQPFSGSAVTTIVSRALKRAGLSPALRGAYLLRHSLATAMVRRGASFSEVGQVLRHRWPDTTGIYAKVDFDALREVALPWPVSGGTP